MITAAVMMIPRLLEQLRRRAAFAVSGAALTLLAIAPAAQAQDYGAMVQQSMARMNSIIAQGQQRVDGMVQQRMQDPQVQAAWQRYVQQNGGRPAMNYQTFTYNYIYTNGFSAQGIAHARSVEAGNQAAEQRALQGYRQAQQNRADAMQAQRDGYFRNQQEAGRGLTGQSTYAGAGGTTALPHTWQPNTMQQYQGRTYYVDQGGQYFVRADNGWWYPMNR